MTDAETNPETGVPAIRFDAIDLICRDIDATVAFYRLVGADIPDDTIWRTASGAHHVSDVPLGAMGLSFNSPALTRGFHAGYDQSPTPTIIGFRVPTRDAVDEVHARLVDAGHPSRQEPYDAFWGARYAIVADPDGRDVSFMSPRDPARNTSPPDV
jgi:uncharacterized glyoxalase superfamily protein PhnB